LWRDEAALPKTEVAALCVILVGLETAFGVRLEVERPPILDEPMLQIDAVNRALANSSVGVHRIGAEIVALDRPTSDKLCQLLSGFSTTWIQLAIFVEAPLIYLGCIDAIEPIGFPVELNSIGV
jgi:hypothetical protein